MLIEEITGVYETTKGGVVEGVITSKRERTMAVRDARGEMHQCWIPNKQRTNKAKGNYKDTSIKCYSISPDGKKQAFDSMALAAAEYNVSASLVSRLSKNGNAVVKGNYAGYRFSRAEETDV